MSISLFLTAGGAELTSHQSKTGLSQVLREEEWVPRSPKNLPPRCVTEDPSIHRSISHLLLLHPARRLDAVSKRPPSPLIQPHPSCNFLLERRVVQRLTPNTLAQAVASIPSQPCASSPGSSTRSPGCLETSRAHTGGVGSALGANPADRLAQAWCGSIPTRPAVSHPSSAPRRAIGKRPCRATRRRRDPRRWCADHDSRGGGCAAFGSGFFFLATFVGGVGMPCRW